MSLLHFTPGEHTPTEAHFTLDAWADAVRVYFGFIVSGVLVFILLSSYLSAPAEFSLGFDWGSLLVYAIILTGVAYSLVQLRQPRPPAQLTIDSAARELRLSSLEGRVTERISFDHILSLGIGQSQLRNGAVSTTYHDVTLRLPNERTFILGSFTSLEHAQTLVDDLDRRLHRATSHPGE